MKKYNVNIFDETSLKDFCLTLDKIEDMFETEKFKQFLLNKCLLTLNNICDMNLPIENEYGIDFSEYINNVGMKGMIDGDDIIFYNDSEIDISAKNMSETTKAKYPNKLSLAKIIEYGIGATGAGTSYSGQVEDWEYDVNNHGQNGWYYKDASGNIYWTTGFEGRFIFYKLSEQVKEYISDWINEYIEKELD